MRRGMYLGDLFGEAIAFALAFSTLASFGLDFFIAYTVGLAPPYVVINPMKHLSSKDGLIAAFKADTISIKAFQVGMYVYMSPSRRFIGRLEANDVRYWTMMKAAMIVGFAFSCPANWLLVKKGVKEAM